MGKDSIIEKDMMEETKESGIENSQIHKLNQINETDRINKIHETKVINETDRINEIHETKGINEIDGTNKIHETKVINEIDGTNKIHETKGINETDKLNETYEINEIYKSNEGNIEKTGKKKQFINQAIKLEDRPETTIKNRDIEFKKVENRPENDSKVHDKAGKGLIVVLIIILFILIGITSTIFGYINKENNAIVSGVSINGVKIEGLTKEQAIKKISGVIKQKISKEILIRYNGMDATTSLEQLGVDFEIEQAVEKAYSVGRDSNLIGNNYQIVISTILNNNIQLEVNLNEENFEEKVKEINSSIPNSMQYVTYCIEGEELIITPGKSGLSIKEDEFKRKLLEFAKNFETNEITIMLQIENREAEKIDIEKIYKKIYADPQNAYVEKNPFKLFLSRDGVDFAITMEQAKNIISEPKEEYIIPLKIIKPEITMEDLGNEAFPDELATYTTKFDKGNVNRSTNISLAAKKINGYVLMPGETFSYNQVVGKRTVQAGFKSAGAFSGGVVVNEVGGGICQVSSTLYNSVLYSNLEVIARSNHSLLTGYVPIRTRCNDIMGWSRV